jgi:hypothetical protein
LGGAAADNLVAGNVIAFNDDAGVNVAQTADIGNRILGNSIFANDGLGIDLGGDGRTANDPTDPDPGPNNLQNFPVIDSARSTNTKTTVEGGLNSLANRTFRIQFFANPSVDGAEGKTFLGQEDVTTDSAGDVEFSFTTRKRVPPGQAITATATRLGTGDTSEFSGAGRRHSGLAARLVLQRHFQNTASETAFIVAATGLSLALTAPAGPMQAGC